jgi:DNA invertase Pin-like site-specific DNA recombinase
VVAVMPWEHTGSKIAARHRERLAVVYVRQSTRQQVVGHQESTRLQYALVDRAVALGWEACRVVLIDDDLGKSGSSAEHRVGFQRLVAEISLGHVGLVLGTEMSRLARSGKDWYQLLELCALGGSLLADADGVYDPTEYNDRLLLGLKGTMSEAELYLINQRMRAGRVNKARRGELAIALPVGYWRHPWGEAVVDPDEQVQSVVRLVFAKFAELGSVQGVVRFLVEHGIQLGIRARSGPDKGEIVWKRPARATITGMVNSPIYAGVYVYGRRLTDRTGVRAADGRARSRRRTARREECLAWIEDALPAYISLAQHEANLVRLKANRAHGDVPGAVRFGPALLAGLLRCGRCGRRMTVGYHVDAGRPRISYNCTGARSEWGGPHCQHLSGGCLDAYVAGQVLQVLSPAAVEVHIQAVQQALADRAAVEKVWQQRLERAQQQVDRARRCYRLAEPEHRLVVRQLEQDWEQALAAQRDLWEQWRRFQRQAPQQLSARDQEAIRQAAADLPRLWEAPGVTHADRKEVVRAVLDEITVSIRGVSELVDLTLHWAGGRTTTGLVRRPIQYFEHLSYYPRLQQRVLELAEAGWHPEKIADQLNRDGYQSARADGPIRYRVVAQILRRNGRPLAHRRDPLPIDPAEAPRDNEWVLPQLAAHLGCTTGTLRGWLRAGHLTGRQETRAPHRWILLAPPEKVDELRDRLTRARGRTTRIHPRFAEALKGDIPQAQSA